MKQSLPRGRDRFFKRSAEKSERGLQEKGCSSWSLGLIRLALSQIFCRFALKILLSPGGREYLNQQFR